VREGVKALDDGVGFTAERAIWLNARARQRLLIDLGAPH
jgi:hypothetical protein